MKTQTPARLRADPDRAMGAMLFGLVTAAWIAKQLGWTQQEFIQAVAVAWEWRRAAAPEET